MKKGWQTKKLSEICEIERGGSPRPIDSFLTNDPNGINWIKIGDTKNVAKYITKTEEKIRPEGAKRSRLVYEGDFILSNSMSFGRPYIMKTTGCIHDGWLVLRKPKVNQDYLYHVLGSDLVFSQFDRLAAGSTVRNLNIGLVKTVEIPFPPLPEQQRIVGILDKAFEGIATAKANAEKNLQNARALFESHLQSVFTQRGEGWVEKRLRDISRINYGYTESASAEKVGPKFLRITDIQDNRVDWTSVPYCSIEASEYPKYKLAEGDIVFARTGATTGKSYLVTEPPQAVFASYLIRVQLSAAEVLPQFVNLFFQTHSYWDSIRSGVSGSAQGGFNATKLGELVIPFPRSSTEQQTIVAKLDDIREETQRLATIYQRKLTALEELKKSLLHQAFSGRL